MLEAHAQSRLRAKKASVDFINGLKSKHISIVSNAELGPLPSQKSMMLDRPPSTFRRKKRPTLSK